MDLGLTDKVAVVLASTSGLGLAVARSLLAEGARVAVSGRDPERLARTLDGLAEHGERVWGAALDVTDGEALRAHGQAVVERWGDVQILVTNAGGPPPGTALDVDDAGLDASLDLTLRSAVHAVEAVLPGMRRRGWGRIVGLTSIAVRQPIATLVYSNVMRAGLTAFLKSLAGEVAADGVLVNTVCTGLFGTGRLEELFVANARRKGITPADERALQTADIPVGRIGDPQELGDFVAFLCSERCSYMNGAALPYDGGATRALL